MSHQSFFAKYSKAKLEEPYDKWKIEGVNHFSAVTLWRSDGVTPVKVYHSAVPYEYSDFKNKSPLLIRSCIVDIFLTFHQLFDIYYKVPSDYGILLHKCTKAIL